MHTLKLRRPARTRPEKRGQARVALPLLAVLAMTASGCAQPVVKGTATYRERIALPPDAVVEITLEDVSRADARAETLGRVSIESPGSPPFPFEIPYDPQRIDERFSYAVRARVVSGDRLLFTTDQAYPVLTRGFGDEVELLLRRIDANAATLPLPLAGVYWRLTRLGGEPVPELDARREPHLVFDGAASRVAGAGGCNRLSGAYEVSGSALGFSPLVTTRMACVDGMDIERDFLAALERVRGWRIGLAELELVDRSGEVLATFAGRLLPE